MHTCEEWMSKYGKLGLKITDKDICGLVGTAFTKICRMELAKSGFQCTGIYPFNRKIFENWISYQRQTQEKWQREVNMANLQQSLQISMSTLCQSHYRHFRKIQRYAYQLGNENEVNKKDENDTEETECIICGKSFEEDWVQCCKCCGWAHVGCADSDQIVYFVCENCKK
ncbi:hypothetical protein ANN_17858 [Periplaneta americana]|uniref:Zinc finger PHD-type domain-containing protein n=1 Tax=Periplaneta americana TaxID=6978 RepID=A0ABQ8SU38_PERAM|nr:hypothetical protein ANN_17858 [Periplaneta americana]